MGEMDVSEYLNKVQDGTMGEHGCTECADSGLAWQVGSFCRKEMPDTERTEGDQSWAKAVEVGADCLEAKGGSESAIIEMIFSICRMLGSGPFR